MNADDKHTISPSEINKFVYCPYQWYYEKTYGAKQLHALYTERNKMLGLTDTRISHFNKGNAFHDQYQLEGAKRLKYGLLVFALISIAVLGACVAFYYVRG